MHLVLTGSGKVTDLTALDTSSFASLPDWTLLERVGLPIGTVAQYDSSGQGPVGTTPTPREAALARLRAGGPPIGWQVLTGDGTAALPWLAPDPDLDECPVVHVSPPCVEVVSPDPPRPLTPRALT